MTGAPPTSPDQMQDILDIAPHIAGTGMLYLKIALAALALTICVFFIYRLLRWLKRRFRSKLNRMKPGERAFYELNQLVKRGLIAKKEWAGFYFALTEILKRYFTDEFKIAILDKTTEEILLLKELFKNVLDEGDWEEMKRFLIESDPIKFANLAVTPNDAEEDFKCVRELIAKAQERTHMKPE